MQEKFEFSVHTSRKCFICFASPIISEVSKENRISLKRICQYLKIDLSKTITVPPNLLSLLSKSDITVHLCLNCAEVVESLTKLCQQLEVIKLQIEYNFKKLQEQLESVNSNPGLLLEYGKELELDSRAKLHSVIVEKLRAELSSKCNDISSQICPTIRLRKVKWIKPKRELEHTPDYEMDSLSGSIHYANSDSDNFENENDSEPLIEMGTDDKTQIISQPKNNQCDICSHVFSTKGSLTKHKRKGCGLLKMKKQKGSLQIIHCKLCPLSFSSKGGLGNHMTRSHSIPQRVRKYECSICQMQFFTSTHLTNHKSIHLGIKYDCDLCGQRFTQKAMMKRHRRLKCSGRKIKIEEAISTNPNKQDEFKCEICEKTFAYERSLKIHAGQVHPINSVIKRFHCPSCSNRFLTPQCLKNHYNSKHLRVRHKCGFCSKIAKSHSKIYKHQLNGNCVGFNKRGKSGLKRVIQLKSTSEIKTELNQKLNS